MIGCKRVGSPVDRVMAPPGSGPKLWVRNLPRSVDHPKRKTQARPRERLEFSFLMVTSFWGWVWGGAGVADRLSWGRQFHWGFPSFDGMILRNLARVSLKRKEGGFVWQSQACRATTGEEDNSLRGKIRIWKILPWIPFWRNLQEKYMTIFEKHYLYGPRCENHLGGLQIR